MKIYEIKYYINYKLKILYKIAIKVYKLIIKICQINKLIYKKYLFISLIKQIK